MKILKIVGAGLLLVGVALFGSEIGEVVSVPGTRLLVPHAEARIGPPLTPVSVAGVARRTARRCAAGVYHCGLTDPRSSHRLLGLVSPEQIFRFADVRNKNPEQQT